MKFYTSLLLSKLSYFALKVLRKPATSFAGYVALKICPDFLSYSKKYINKKFINITGTNGKTTTSGLISHILTYDKNSVIHNVKGANMITGIANVFAIKLNPLQKYDYAVIETDEAYLTKVYDFVKGDYLVVTNLFKDQLDRYGDVDFTQKIITEAILKNKDLKLVLNADDPVVASFGKLNSSVYFGFENVEYMGQDNIQDVQKDVVSCICGSELEYSKRFYSHQGKYYCQRCGYKRPECNYTANAKIFDDYFELEVKHHDKTDIFNVPLVGLYNAYNAMAAISTALECGIDAKQIKNALCSFKSIFGRTETRVINGHKTLIQLIKNPDGASEVLKTLDLNSNILIAINDEYADGRDVSWLWDTCFEKLKEAKKLIVTSGVRAYDMAVRLKYCDIPESRVIVEPDVKKAIKYITDNTEKDEKITILPSYTALLKISKY